MSLRVWLPLNGSLDNQGLDNVVVTNNGATIDNNGKIGKCYSFNGSNYLTFTDDYLKSWFSDKTHPFTFCTWIYLNADETDRVIILGKYNHNPFINWELTGAGIQTTAWGPTSGYVQKNSNGKVSTLVWTHIAAVFDGTNLSYYFNGTLDNTQAFNASALTSEFTSNLFYIGSDTRSGVTRLKGKMNDFRIYDHALSAQEVKQIAQGLVLHYPLNRNGWGNENLALGTDVPHTTTANKPYTLSDYNLNGKTVTLSCRIDADNITLTGSNQRIGLSLKCTSGSTNYYIEVWKSYRATQISSNGRVAFFGGLSNNSSFHGYISHTCTCPADAVSFGAYTQDLSSGTVKISHVKLEIGDKRTAWCPNSMETLASNYNINTGNVPLGYQELEYIESAGASWIDTRYVFNPETDSCKIIFKGNDTSHNGMIFGNDVAPYFWVYYYGSSGIRIYGHNGTNGQQGITGIASDTNQHTIEYKNKHYYIDGVDKGSLSNTYGACSNSIYLFNYRNNNTYPFKGRIYYVDIKTGSTLKKKFIPARRTIDSAIGMLETVSGKFYPSMTSTAFTAGTAINIPTSITYDISGFKNNGVSIGAIGQDENSPKYGSSAVFNGVDTYIRANPLPLETKTISFWIKFYDMGTGTGASTYRVALSAANVGLCFGISDAGVNTILFMRKSGSNQGKRFATSYVLNTWYHIVIVKTDDINRDLYINGEQITPTATNTYYAGSIDDLVIGCRYNSTYREFTRASISDVRIYCSALSATDVKELYEYNPIS